MTSLRSAVGRFAACAFVVAAAALAQSAEEETQEPEPAPAWGDEAEGFRLSIAVDKSEVEATEAIMVHISLKNTRKEEVPVASMRPMAVYHMEVLLAKPKGGAPLTLYGRHLEQAALDSSAVVHTVEQGAVISETIHLNRIFDMTLSGTYKVTVTRVVPKQDNPDAIGHVVSNALEITVKEPAPTESE